MNPLSNALEAAKAAKPRRPLAEELAGLVGYLVECQDLRPTEACRWLADPNNYTPRTHVDGSKGTPPSITTVRQALAQYKAHREDVATQEGSP